MNRNTHLLYLWSKKNKKAELKGIIFDKSISLISGISSDDWSFSHLLMKIINSFKFIKYLIDLDKFIRSKWGIRNRRTMSTIDNTRSHSAKKSVEKMQEKFDATFFYFNTLHNMLLLKTFSLSWRAIYAWD